MVFGRFRMVAENQDVYESYKAVIKYNLPKGCATAQLLLYNIDGKQIKKITLDCTSNAFVPEVSDELPTGTYLFSIIADKKFVVNGEPITLR